MLSRVFTDSTNSGENIYGMMKPSIPGSMPGVSLRLFSTFLPRLIRVISSVQHVPRNTGVTC